ncbi:MAG: SDR family oxidoreductase [Sedimentisphaerales bacterium]|nr:SDR family oxidoreductase [Sedimentisphaerales bacterium]
MPRLNQKRRVLITGCSSGFGLLTAVKAAQAGYDVVATMRNLDKAGYLTKALDQGGTTATIEKMDITNPDSIREIVEKHAPIDVLINNAGILIMGSFLDLTEAEVRRVLETNYFGAVELTRAVAPSMIERQSGIIINIASLAGCVGHPFNSAYAASKHALIGFSQSIRVELMPFNVKVVSMEPGYHKTEIIRANANLSENFYNRKSPFFEWNRGFLRLMMDRVIPKAGEPEAVADKIVKIMELDKPQLHYVLGRDARWATRFEWLGLGQWLACKVFEKLEIARHRENRRAEYKKKRRKQTPTTRTQES